MEEKSSKLTLAGLAAVIDERDKRYDAIFALHKEALEKAITAVNKQTEQAFIAAQTAIDKAEASQMQYNDEHNNLTRRMVLVERYDSDQKTLSEKIDELKNAVNDLQVKLGVGSGKEIRGTMDKVDKQWVSLVVISIVNIVVFVLIRILMPGS